MNRIGLSSVAGTALLVLGLIIGVAAGYGIAISTGARETTTTTAAILSETTTTTVVTTTPTIPTEITFSGTVKAGNSVTAVHFVSNTNHISYPGTVASGSYTISNLPNPDTYTVTLDYTGLLSGGTCTAGTLAIYYQFTPAPQTANWSC